MRESLSLAFQNILDLATKKLGMNLRDYTFHVAKLEEDHIGVVYFSNNPKKENVYISYHPSSPNFKIGHLRGSANYIYAVLNKFSLVSDSGRVAEERAVSVNGDTQLEYDSLKDGDIDPNFEKIEEVAEKIETK